MGCGVNWGEEVCFHDSNHSCMATVAFRCFNSAW
jgi:hypothetical protein